MLNKVQLRRSLLAGSSLLGLLLFFQNCGGTPKSAGTTSAASTSAVSPSSTSINSSPNANCWSVIGITLLNQCDGPVLMGAGMVGIGNSSPITQLDVTGSIAVSNQSGGYSFKDANGNLDARIYEGVANNLNLKAGSGGFIKFMNASATAGAFFDINGNWFTSGQFQNSDVRLKQDIKPLRDVLSHLDGIDGVTYDWKDEARRKTDGPQVGVIAQKLQAAYPQLVKSSENLDPKSPLKTVLSVDYNHLTAVLLAGLKELSASWHSDSKQLHEENERLLKRVEALERRLADTKVSDAK